MIRCRLAGISLLIVVAVMVTSASVPPARAADGKRVALVIGNGGYDAKNGPLRNPVNDAGDMAQALREVGFVVAQETDVDRPRMLRAVCDFGRQLKDAEVGLFYYSGHGMQVNGRNYLAASPKPEARSLRSEA
jgi:hypothetical protein